MSITPIPSQECPRRTTLHGLALFVGWHFGVGCGVPEGSGQSSESSDPAESTTTEHVNTASTPTTTGLADGGGQASTPFTIQVELSEVIPTVGIVEWSHANAQALVRAHIEFGEDLSYAHTAPVDLDIPGYRTLLLGLSASTEYHFRIVATTQTGGVWFSEDQTLTTGPLPNKLLLPTVESPHPESVAPGFTLTSLARDKTAVILNESGEYVWWYTAKEMDSLTRVRMSHSGRYIWLRDTPQKRSRGQIRRVSLDGLDTLVFNLHDTHHDLAVLPDDSIAYLDREGHCDLVREIDRFGAAHSIFDLSAAFPDPLDKKDGCHANSLHYHPDTDTYTVSLRNDHMYAHFSREGERLWVLGGKYNDFEGITPWHHQHGYHVFGDRFLFFNNGESQSPSRVLEYKLDLDKHTAELVWSYESGLHSIYFGDVQRLTNGNTQVTYSWLGVIHEVDADGTLLQSLTWPLGGALGYAMKRSHLYGPPPK